MIEPRAHSPIELLALAERASNASFDCGRSMHQRIELESAGHACLYEARGTAMPEGLVDQSIEMIESVLGPVPEEVAP